MREDAGSHPAQEQEDRAWRKGELKHRLPCPVPPTARTLFNDSIGLAQELDGLTSQEGIAAAFNTIGYEAQVDVYCEGIAHYIARLERKPGKKSALRRDRQGQQRGAWMDRADAPFVLKRQYCALDYVLRHRALMMVRAGQAESNETAWSDLVPAWNDVFHSPKPLTPKGLAQLFKRAYEKDELVLLYLEHRERELLALCITQFLVTRALVSGMPDPRNSAAGREAVERVLQAVREQIVQKSPAEFDALVADLHQVAA